MFHVKRRSRFRLQFPAYLGILRTESYIVKEVIP